MPDPTAPDTLTAAAGRVDVYVQIDGTAEFAGNRQIGESVVLDMDRDGNVLGVEVLGAQEVTIDGSASSTCPTR
jgi:uncharacterized protein YuzE